MSLGYTLVLAGLFIAGTSAARSTWSPCGLSMLSSITPFSEQGRGHRYSWTALWFVAGAAVGGACLGAGAAAMAWVVALTGLAAHPAAVGSLAGVVALGGAAVDAGVFGDVLPLIRRQVDDGWLTRYRAWLYGAGFGWQIGVGLATYLMSAGVVVLVVLAALTGSPAAALLVGTGFGLARGLTVFLTARCDTPDRLRALHRRLDRAGALVRWSAAGAQALAGAGLIAAVLAGGATASSPWWLALFGPPLVLVSAFAISTGAAGGGRPRRVT